MYMRIQQYIQSKIRSGEWEPGAMIPTEAALSKQFGCSRITVTTAVRELVKDGLIYRVQGKGSFVSGAAEPESVYEQSGLSQMGVSLDDVSIPGEHKVWSIQLELPTEEVAQLLRLDEVQKVIVINKTKYVDGKIFAAERLYLPETLFLPVLEEHLEELHFSEFAPRCEVFPGRSYVSSEPVICDEETAQMLGIPEGTPILRFCIEIYDTKGHPVACDYAYVEGKQNRRQL